MVLLADPTRDWPPYYCCAAEPGPTRAVVLGSSSSWAILSFLSCGWVYDDDRGLVVVSRGRIVSFGRAGARQ